MLTLQLKGKTEATVEFSTELSRSPVDIDNLLQVLYTTLGKKDIRELIAKLMIKGMKEQEQKMITTILKTGEVAITVTKPTGEKGVVSEAEFRKLVANIPDTPLHNIDDDDLFDDDDEDEED